MFCLGVFVVSKSVVSMMDIVIGFYVIEQDFFFLMEEEVVLWLQHFLFMVGSLPKAFL